MSYHKLIEPILSQASHTQNDAIERLIELLRIPSISTQKKYASSCRQAAQYLCDDLTNIGFQSALYEVHWAEPGHPMVVAHYDNVKDSAENAPHILFYGHYDVQPIDPEHLWHSNPFEPKIIEQEDGRRVIIARGASDDKGQIMTFIEACRAWMAVEKSLPLKMTILLEGEEESGGENLLPFLEQHKEILKADLALICDTSMADRVTPAITTSLRGMIAEEVEITCASHDLHSGIYGNAAANPILILCQALSSLRDEKGRINLEGFYDNIKIPSEETRQAWKKLYPSDEAFLKHAGLSQAAGEENFTALEQTWCRPSCEINGISGGYQDEGFKTVIPSKASAKVSFRLVVGQDPKDIREKFRAHMRAALPKDATIKFKSFGASPGFEIPQNNPYLPLALKALSEEWHVPAVTIGCGGSIPVAQEVKKALHLDALMIGFAQEDDKIHSPNEQYGLESFHKGIRSWIRIFAELAYSHK